MSRDTLFHSLSGCDTTSSFYGKSKVRCWVQWTTSNQEFLDEAFIQLINCPKEIPDTHFNSIKSFMMKVYFGTFHGYREINEARIRSFFLQAEPKIRSIILSEDALKERIKRAVYQVGRLWR